jgi:hypothetical protein
MSAAVRVPAPGGTPVAVTVLDALGRVVWTGTASGTLSLPTARWAPGVYAVRTSTGQATAAARGTVVR